MADDDECAVIGEQPSFNRLDGVDIQMVGRLVENEQRWGIGTAECAGKAGAQHLPAAQRLHPLQGRIRAKAKAGQCRPAGVVAGTGIEPLKIFEDRLAALQNTDALVQQSEWNIYGNGSFEGWQFSGDYLQKNSFCPTRWGR